MTGFSFLELILVIVLLGVLFAYALPALTGTIEATGMPESCERLRSLIHLTRAAAMRDGVRYRLAFPGAPNPDDPDAERLVETAATTQQPNVEREKDPVNEPGAFEGADLSYDIDGVLRAGVRCIAVRVGLPSFDINRQSPFAGPEVNATESPMDVLTFNPDGTCDSATFTLTTMGPDEEPVESDVARIINVIVDGRTGQTWFQRPLRNTEVELLNEYRASPIMHVDFVKPDPITEANILHLQAHVQRTVVGGGGGQGASTEGAGQQGDSGGER
jgi:type II secretory pathway pseudopilin PulG